MWSNIIISIEKYEVFKKIAPYAIVLVWFVKLHENYIKTKFKKYDNVIEYDQI